MWSTNYTWGVEAADWWCWGFTPMTAFVIISGPFIGHEAIKSRGAQFLWKMRRPILICRLCLSALLREQKQPCRQAGPGRLTIVLADFPFHFIYKCHSDAYTQITEPSRMKFTELFHFLVTLFGWGTAQQWLKSKSHPLLEPCLAPQSHWCKHSSTSGHGLW